MELPKRATLLPTLTTLEQSSNPSIDPVYHLINFTTIRSDKSLTLLALPRAMLWSYNLIYMPYFMCFLFIRRIVYKGTYCNVPLVFFFFLNVKIRYFF